MTKINTKAITLLSILILICTQYRAFSTGFTSAQTGYFSEGSTWVGGMAPAPGDDILISAGHTVTLDVNAQVKNITIQAGAVLDNAAFKLTIYSTTPGGNPEYANFGTHNGTGNLVTYDGGPTSLSGDGILNCNIEIQSYGLNILNTCSLTINGNIGHSIPGNNGMNGKEFIGCWQEGSILTINGDIVTDEQYQVGITVVAGTLITVNGNVSLAGGLDSGSGSVLTNQGTFNISGDMALGPYSSYCQNTGSMVIGGNLTGAYDTYFIQEMNSSVKFGGSVFQDGDGYLFAVESPLMGSSQPNTIEYNGVSAQNIGLPADMAYSNLIISNINATASITTDIMVNGDLIIKPGSALTVGTGSSLSVGGSLTLESDATGTGSFISGSGIAANIQRFISGHNGNANDGWHFLSSPVSAQAISEFHTAGSGDDFYKWDEPTSTWINRTAEGGGLNGSYETDFSVGTGYLYATTANQTKTFTGNINNSDVNISNLTYSASNTYAGWHLLGNPFSSALTWNNGDWALNNVDAIAQVWNEANASYTVIATNEVIPAANGFMLHASAGDASLTIPAGARVHENTNWYKNAGPDNRILLTAIDVEGGTAQPSVIRFDANATERYDSNYDSYFLQGFAPVFYSGTQDENYALSTLPELTGGLTIPLGFVKNASTRFTIELTENFPGQAVYLTDLKNSVTTNLVESSYSFNAVEGDDPDRFLLHFSTLGINKQPTHQRLSAWVYDKKLFLHSEESGNLCVYDLQGRMLLNYTVDSADLQVFPVNLPSGAYLVRLQGKSTVKSVKVIVQ